MLLKACATGQHLKEATITHRKSGKGQQEFLIVKMNDVIITAVTHGGSSDQPASENVTMSDGYEWLVAHPVGSSIAGGSAAWAAGQPTQSTLDAYDNGLLCAPHRK